jgi:hypothetical protein
MGPMPSSRGRRVELETSPAQLRLDALIGAPGRRQSGVKIKVRSFNTPEIVSPRMTTAVHPKSSFQSS